MTSENTDLTSRFAQMRKAARAESAPDLATRLDRLSRLRDGLLAQADTLVEADLRGLHTSQPP